MSLERLSFKEKADYRARYEIMKRDYLNVKTYPPFKAFVQNTLPHEENGNIVYEKALCLERSWSENFWMKATNRLTKKERQDFQIVVIPTPKSKKGSEDDFSKEFTRKIQENPIENKPIAKLKRKKYSGDVEFGREIENSKPAKSIYIASSIVTEDDLADVVAVAEHYKRLGAKEINLISPFIRDEREDKNVGKDEKGKIAFNGRIIKIRDLMHKLSKHIDRVVTFEPHSGATQSFAAIYGIALAPMSLEEELVGSLKNRILKEKNTWKLVGPDVGRNLVANRIATFFDITPIHLEQNRDAATLKKTAMLLTKEQKNDLKDKNVILYDDEGGTLGTIKNAVDLFVEAEVKSIHIFLGHARLQKKWRKNLDDIFQKAHEKGINVKIYVSDSRRPLGDLKNYIRRHKKSIVINSVADKVINVIKTSVRGVNYWVNNSQEGVNWERSILQPIPGFDKPL